MLNAESSSEEIKHRAGIVLLLLFLPLPHYIVATRQEMFLTCWGCLTDVLGTFPGPFGPEFKYLKVIGGTEQVRESVICELYANSILWIDFSVFFSKWFGLFNISSCVLLSQEDKCSRQPARLQQLKGCQRRDHAPWDESTPGWHHSHLLTVRFIPAAGAWGFWDLFLQRVSPPTLLCHPPHLKEEAGNSNTQTHSWSMPLSVSLYPQVSKWAQQTSGM